MGGLAGITLSRSSGEFVLHVPVEYDYRFETTQERRSNIVYILDSIFRGAHPEAKGLPIFYSDSKTLEKCATTQADKKKGITKMPKHDAAEVASTPSFLSYLGIGLNRAVSGGHQQEERRNEPGKDSGGP